MLHVTHYLWGMKLERGGVVRSVLDLCSVLASRGHGIELATRIPGDVPEAWREPQPGRPHLVELNMPSLKPWSRDPRVMPLLDGCDVLHLHVPWDPALPALAREAARRGIPYLVSAHGMLDEWSMTQSRLKKRLYHAGLGRRLLEGAAAVHCTAASELQQSRRWFPRGRGVVLPLVIDLTPYLELPPAALAEEAFAEALGDAGEPVLLFLSRLHIKKGVDLLPEIAARLRERGVGFRMLVAGPDMDGSGERLKQTVRERKLGDAVHVVGKVMGGLKGSLYRRADLFVLPTHQENFGLVLPESMACGTPVVTTRGVDIWRELEEHGATVVDRTAEAFADAIERRLADRADLKARGERGRAWVMQRFAPDAVASGFEDLYRRLAAGETVGEAASGGAGGIAEGGKP